MSSGKSIVAADDLVENRLLVKGILEQAGYVVFAAVDGADCLSILSRVVPRLVLLDIQMPDISGFEVCRRIRLNPSFAHVPIVFLTACKTMDEVQEGIAAGGNDFVLKPIREEMLLERVKHWTSRVVR
ncbi:MAG TPA: response regulator [Alphaproteobacteria bacterium]|nr:response regulator [Alphaproteobacteria bacterium]